MLRVDRQPGDARSPARAHAQRVHTGLGRFGMSCDYAFVVADHEIPEFSVGYLAQQADFRYRKNAGWRHRDASNLGNVTLNIARMSGEI